MNKTMLITVLFVTVCTVGAFLFISTDTALRSNSETRAPVVNSKVKEYEQRFLEIEKALNIILQNANSELSKKESRDVDEKIIALQGEVADLGFELNRLRNGESNHSTPMTEQELAETTRQSQSNTEQYFEFLHRSLAAQEEDPDWSLTTQESILNTLEDIETVSLSEVICKSTICRMQAKIIGQLDPQMIYDQTFRELRWKGPTEVSINPTTGLMVAFLIRPGNDFPKKE